MTINQAIVTPAAKASRNQLSTRIALFNEDGTPYNDSDAIPPVTVDTAAATVAKTTTSAEPAVNTVVPIVFSAGNSAASPTVAFNGGAARPILLGGTAPAATEITVAAGGVVLFWFDGTSLHQFGVVA